MILTQNFNQIDIRNKKENTTGLMGLGWIYQIAKQYGVSSEIKKIFSGKRSNREIEPERKIMAGVLTILAGGEKIEDIEKLRADKALTGSLGWKSIASPDTMLNFYGNKKNSYLLRKVNEACLIKAMKRSKIMEFTYDSDATYFNSEKNCAKYSYQEEKQMSAMLGFIVELGGMCATMDYRPGNISPREGILKQLKRAKMLAKKAGKKIARFRHDSAAHNKKIFRYCEEEGIKYFVSLVKKQIVNMEIKEIPCSAWQPVPDQEGTEYAETRYWMQDEKGVL